MHEQHMIYVCSLSE